MPVDGLIQIALNLAPLSKAIMPSISMSKALDVLNSQTTSQLASNIESINDSLNKQIADLPEDILFDSEQMQNINMTIGFLQFKINQADENKELRSKVILDKIIDKHCDKINEKLSKKTTKEQFLTNCESLYLSPKVVPVYVDMDKMDQNIDSAKSAAHLSPAELIHKQTLSHKIVPKRDKLSMSAKAGIYLAYGATSFGGVQHMSADPGAIHGLGFANSNFFTQINQDNQELYQVPNSFLTNRDMAGSYTHGQVYAVISPAADINSPSRTQVFHNKEDANSFCKSTENKLYNKISRQKPATFEERKQSYNNAKQQKDKQLLVGKIIKVSEKSNCDPTINNNINGETVSVSLEFKSYNDLSNFKKMNLLSGQEKINEGITDEGSFELEVTPSAIDRIFQHADLATINIQDKIEAIKEFYQFDNETKVEYSNLSSAPDELQITAITFQKEPELPDDLLKDLSQNGNQTSSTTVILEPDDIDKLYEQTQSIRNDINQSM